MGFFLSQTLSKSSSSSSSFCPTLLLLLLVLVLVSSSSSSSLNDQTEPANTARGSADAPDRYHQVFYIKNTSPFFLDRHRGGPVDIGNKKRMKKKIMTSAKTTTTMTRRKMVKKMETNRPSFSVMLPKGFVPPSGSSPCHNENPNSVVFFCELAPSSKP